MAGNCITAHWLTDDDPQYLYSAQSPSFLQCGLLCLRFQRTFAPEPSRPIPFCAARLFFGFLLGRTKCFLESSNPTHSGIQSYAVLLQKLGDERQGMHSSPRLALCTSVPLKKGTPWRIDSRLVESREYQCAA